MTGVRVETERAETLRGGPGSVVPHAEVRTYYDHPVVKPPAWTWEIPWYFFTGGIAGASSVVAVVADAAGDERLGTVARRAAAGAALVSPALLIADLGRPARFLNMLRVFKVTSPMSVGSWLLAAFGPAAVASAVLDELGAPRALRRMADGAAAALGPPLATYTAALVANSAVPVWHEGRHTLPFVFAGGSIASAGGVATALLAPEHAGGARRVALAGAVLDGIAVEVMERRAGDLAAPYHEGTAGQLSRAAKTLTAAGAGLIATLGRRRRAAAVSGAALLLAGQVCQRWAVFRAGFQSAENPAATVAPQRERLEAS